LCGKTYEFALDFGEIETFYCINPSVFFRLRRKNPAPFTQGSLGRCRASRFFDTLSRGCGLCFLLYRQLDAGGVFVIVGHGTLDGPQRSLPLSLGEVARLWRDGEGLCMPTNFASARWNGVTDRRGRRSLQWFSGVRWSGPSGTPVPTMHFRGCGGRRAERREKWRKTSLFLYFCIDKTVFFIKNIRVSEFWIWTNLTPWVMMYVICAVVCDTYKEVIWLWRFHFSEEFTPKKTNIMPSTLR